MKSDRANTKQDNKESVVQLKEHIRQGVQAEQVLSHDDENHDIDIMSCRDYLQRKFESVIPLIGEENDPLLVRGEGMFIPGVGGVGGGCW